MPDGANSAQQTTQAAPAAAAATNATVPGAGAAGAAEPVLAAPAAAAPVQTSAQQAAPAAAAAAPAAPVEIELKFADGVQVDKGLIDGFKPIAKDLKLDSAGAQKLADYVVGYQAQAAKAQETAAHQLTAKYVEAAKADKEYGGANFDVSVEIARKALVRFGTPELQKALELHGMSNHPELIRWAVRVGKAIAEDTVTGTQTQQTGGKLSNEELLKVTYPTMFAPKG